MQKIVKSGSGWRIGWNPAASEYQGLIGSEDWAIELTAPELEDFCRLAKQLATTMETMADELMDEERITCEAESDRLWLEVEGYPHTYSLRFILNSGRQCEGGWPPPVVPELLEAMERLKVF
ncbi:DUF1818 family protein [Spirulina sp. CS-785/01]|uniref:DUF1818 family protein n=1 Tax=Spirulina sp. CS-785/01 TaxID=3021716 RepID=UPI00232EF184|nr:DUF1818 family protein [Spirulina sp. CS-785/01]MDB9313243.1 DUF1818 family protein [Spirulina sp. CS-785/01]